MLRKKKKKKDENHLAPLLTAYPTHLGDQP